MIDKTKWFSWKVGNLARGCKLCVQGKKTVLFITGLCSKKTSCYYCPIADNRKGNDVVYANERPINHIEELYDEIKLCNSEGVGITGGDPLMKIDRVVEYIKKIKERFGKNFHIHLYCPTELVDKEKLQRLYEAGLDEIRFHLDIEDKKDWGKINLAKELRWKIGVEVPVIPGKEEKYMEMINFLKGKIDFLNLNELELSDSEACKLHEMGFIAKDDISYAVKCSEELALRLLNHCEGINVHYCTVKLKDDVQITNRLKNRLRNVKQNFDEVEDENLVRGVIYTKKLKPSFGYRKMLEEIKNKGEVIKNLEEIKNDLVKKLNIKKDSMIVDKLKLRILTSRKIIKKFKDKIKEMNLIPAIAKESPSYDQFEIEIDFV